MTADDLIPVDDDCLDDIAAELGNMAAPTGKAAINGLVAASRNKVILFEFDKGGKPEVLTDLVTIGEPNTTVLSLAFHNDRLWFGTGGNDKTGYTVSCNFKWPEPGKQPGVAYSQGSEVMGLFSHNGVLYDTGRLGIDDTFKGEKRVALPDWMQITKIHHMFNYKDVPHAIAYKKGIGFTVYSVAINGDDMRFTKEAAHLKKIPASTIVRAADIKGSIVATGWVSQLYDGNGSRINVHLPAGSVAYDQTADEVYVGCDTGTKGGRINVFRPEIKDGNLEFDYINNRELTGLPGMVNDMLLVTEGQIECIKRQMNE
jgi:hypothetical protein